MPASTSFSSLPSTGSSSPVGRAFASPRPSAKASIGGVADVLSQQRLNRALLARQLLLKRATLSIPTALERLGGIQNQYAPNAYIRLWSCLAEFEREDLTRAYEDATVVQAH